MTLPSVILVLVLAASAFVYRRWSRRKHIRTLLATGLTDHQRAIVADEVPLTRRLPPQLRPALEGRINRFLDQMTFHGCNGLEVTEAMELSIAAQASLLVVNRDDWYDTLRTILIYPAAFKSMRKSHDGYVVTEQPTVRLGESWARGPVILSWADSEDGALNDRDGRNVVLHEFAHQFDGLNGSADGVPILNRGQNFATWEKVFVDAYLRLSANVESGRSSLISAYGATGHEEFFAVAVELFFERPADLKAAEPEVYEQLAQLFWLDPVTWN